MAYTRRNVDSLKTLKLAPLGWFRPLLPFPLHPQRWDMARIWTSRFWSTQQRLPIIGKVHHVCWQWCFLVILWYIPNSFVKIALQTVMVDSEPDMWHINSVQNNANIPVFRIVTTWIDNEWLVTTYHSSLQNKSALLQTLWKMVGVNPLQKSSVHRLA